MKTLEDAISFAAERHRGQVDKFDQPYILHLIRVMLAGKTEHEKMAGVLHDIIEDCGMTAEQLMAFGYPIEVVEAVATVTKLPHEEDNYKAFIQRIASSGSQLAIKVKLNDLLDNMNVKRLPRNVSDEEFIVFQERNLRYSAAYLVLMKALE